MLSDPEQLCWVEDGQPYAFEIRTQLVPAASLHASE